MRHQPLVVADQYPAGLADVACFSIVKADRRYAVFERLVGQRQHGMRIGRGGK